MDRVSATFVVVGGGIAGVSCAEMLATLEPNEKIILISASPIVKAVTNVQNLTKNLATFDVSEVDKETFASKHRSIQVIIDVVTFFDHEKQVVQTKSGTEIAYKKLCLCHGARPKLISSDNPFVIGIRDTESVEKFQQNLKGANRVVIVGNGGIATELIFLLDHLEIVWAVKDDSISTTFLDPGAGQFFMDFVSKTGSDADDEANFMKRMKYGAGKLDLDNEGSSLVKGAALGPDWLSSGIIKEVNSTNLKKVLVEYESEVLSIYSHEEFVASGKRETNFLNVKYNEKLWNVYVELTNGKIFGCDFVVSATGVMPNGDLINPKNKLLKLDSDNAILVNENMETNVADVFAAGDVCKTSWGSETPAHWFQMRLWTQARQMGMFAAQCLSDSLANTKRGLDFSFEMFSHVTKFFGFKVVLLGLFNGQGLDKKEYDAIVRVTKGKEFVKVIIKDGRMQGAVMIGETDLEETFENLILNQIDVSSYGEDLLNPNIDIEDYFD